MKSRHHGILTKTLFIVCLVVVTLTGTLIFTSHQLVTRRFLALESDEAKTNIERVLNELTNSLRKIESTVGDWAPWDDAYTFVKEGNSSFIENNLTDETFKTLHLNFILFFDTRDELVYRRFYDHNQEKMVAPDPAVINTIRSLPRLFRHASEKSRISGLIMAPASPVLVAAAPIVTSTFNGPVRGTLIFGAYLDASEVARMGEQVKLPVQMHLYPAMQDVFTPAAASRAAEESGRRFAVQAADDRTLTAYGLADDLTGQPAVVFAVTRERNFFRQGMTIWRDHTLSMVIMGVFFILSLGLLLHRSILRHLTALSRELDHLTVTGRHDVRLTVAGNDEIGQLAAQINTMLTSLQHYREQQRKNEEHLKDIIDSVNCGIMIVTAEDRRAVAINKTGMTMLGRNLDDIIGKAEDRLVLPCEADRDPVRERKGQAGMWEGNAIRPDGSRLPVLKSVAGIRSDDRHYLIVSFIDISGLKKVQQELQASEEKYRRFFEDDLTGNFISTTAGQIIDCNPAFAAMLGYQTVAEVKQIAMQSLYFNSTSRDNLLERLRKEKKIIHHEGALRHRQGDPVYCIANLTGEFDGQGHLVQMRGYLFDDTRRILLEKEIRQTQKMEAIGTMAGGIAHDFNNILAGIMGYTEIVMRDQPDVPNSRSRQYLRNILTAGERARGLIDKILTFSRQNETELRPIRLQRTVDDVLQLIRASLPATIDIETHLHSRATILADQIQIHQVIMNLCTNAGHAMKACGGTLSLTLRDVTLDAAFAARHAEITTGAYVRLQVADTGEGIPEHLLDRIFDPFFTTKKKGEGTGLGLSMIHGIVSSMRGLITVDSRLGEGTSFDIYLPRISEEEIHAPIEHQVIPTGGEHIVYVDDERFLVDIGTEILRGLGYKVTGFTESGKALKYLTEHAAEVNLVISDMTMPRITGLELAQNLQQLDVPPPVIICTGHTEGLTRNQARESGIFSFLLKPVTVHNLAVTVREVLDGNISEQC